MLNSRKLIATIEAYYEVSIHVEPGCRAKGEAKIPRFMAIKMAHEELHLPFSTLARIFNVLYQTIGYNIEAIEKLMIKDERLRQEYDELRRIVLEMNKVPTRQTTESKA
jgi:chromosomal replication initiation ATPase DnaA